MNKQTEALKMAIEALESFEKVYGDTDLLMPHNFYKSLQACKEALEQKDDEIKILKLIANRAKSFPNFPMGYHLQEVFAYLGEKQPIKEALEQPAQEYLTRAQQVIRANNSAQEPVAAVQEGNASWYRATPKNGTLLYTHPAPQPAQSACEECIGFNNKLAAENDRLKSKISELQRYAEAMVNRPTYPAPSWQGLSDDKINVIWDDVADVLGFAKAIEAELKEKNAK